jgi:flavorubredoxin
MKIIFTKNGFGGHYAEKIWFWYDMEAHHLAKHKGMNFNSLITQNEERLARKF